ncbi:MAG: hypothetical protein M5U34_31335 [Chloroflexi bacterium]|nr:hypothetical protein [Chloroflexota bacterium]
MPTSSPCSTNKLTNPRTYSATPWGTPGALFDRALPRTLCIPDFGKRLPGLKTEAERAERRHRDNALAGRIERDGIEAFVDFWESLPLWDSQKQLSAETRARLRQQRLQNNPLGLANSLRGMGTGMQPSLWHKLSEITMPALLLTGELDHKFCTIGEEMAQLIPASHPSHCSWCRPHHPSGKTNTIHTKRGIVPKKYQGLSQLDRLYLSCWHFGKQHAVHIGRLPGVFQG